MLGTFGAWRLLSQQQTLLRVRDHVCSVQPDLSARTSDTLYRHIVPDFPNMTMLRPTIWLVPPSPAFPRKFDRWTRMSQTKCIFGCKDKLSCYFLCDDVLAAKNLADGTYVCWAALMRFVIVNCTLICICKVQPLNHLVLWVTTTDLLIAVFLLLDKSSPCSACSLAAQIFFSNIIIRFWDPSGRVCVHICLLGQCSLSLSPLAAGLYCMYRWKHFWKSWPRDTHTKYPLLHQVLYR